MKRILTAFLLAVFASTSFALGLGNDNAGGDANQNQGQAQGQNQGQNQGQLQGQAQGQLQGQGQAQGLINTNNISNRISNDVRNNAAAFAAASSGSSSGASSTVGNTTARATGGNSGAVSGSGGNTLTVNEAAIPADTSVTYGGTYTVKNTPAFALGNVYPTAPCMGSSTVGGSGPGFSIGIGTSWKDDECGVRETSRSFAGMGLKEDALAILCTSQYAAAAPSCKPVAAQVPAPAPK